MKKLVLAFVSYCFFSTLFAQAPNYPTWPSPGISVMPSGSYSQTCTNCSMDANNTLICSCADRQGFPRNTALPAARYCLSVDNINGQLRCSQWRRPPFPPKRHHSGRIVDIQAGPIWNQRNAQQICPMTCQNNQGTWTGQWQTTVPSQMSVCQCRLY